MTNDAGSNTRAKPLLETMRGMPDAGTKVQVRDAYGRMLPKRVAVRGRVGYDFPCIAVCREEEWLEAVTEGRLAEWVPWPVEDVYPG